jgi:hypothetical protein
VDPITARKVTVSGATAQSLNRRVTLTFSPAQALAVPIGSVISVSGFPSTASAYNVASASVVASTTTSVTYTAASTGNLPTSVAASALGGVSLVLPSDPTHGRGFDPMTTADADPLKWQPQSALVRCNSGERVLLRLANLGYQNPALSMDNVPMRIVGKDALLLKNGSITHYIDTNSVEVGPGESRDVLFTAPGFSGSNNGLGTSGQGYDSYLLFDRNLAYADNAGDPASPGGMLTEVRVYPPAGTAGALAPQSQPNA